MFRSEKFCREFGFKFVSLISTGVYHESPMHPFFTFPTVRGQLSPCTVGIPTIYIDTGADLSQHGYRSRRNRRLANHLLRERDALFTFLNCPGLEATNWRAEQAIRSMVVARKAWDGNRTARGAQTQSILVSFLQTCRQQLQPTSSLLQSLLCSSQTKVLDLVSRSYALNNYQRELGHAPTMPEIRPE